MRAGTTSPELLVPPLNRGRPLRAQLEATIRGGVQDGRLRPGVRLPSSRALAADLGLSRRLVVEAYAQLVAEGYLEARAGSGTRVRAVPGGGRGPRGTADGTGGLRAGAGRHPATGVHPAARGVARSGRSAAGEDDRSAGPRPHVDLFPGGPDLSRFPRRAWGAALRGCLNDLPDRHLGYGSPGGAHELRVALADRLGRVRGAAVEEPRQIVVCGGYTQGARLLLEGLVEGGARRVAVEEPGYALNAMLVEAAGLELVPVGADADGLDVEALAGAHVDAVIVTPAHGHPLGGVLAPERRAALVRWARERGALVIEDDYDAEFRYDAEPVGTLQGLAPDVVALVGTVSKTLAPALRLGWVLAPSDRVPPLISRRGRQDMGSPLLEQLALARLISSGGLDRHVRRLRPHYRARRDAVLAALAATLPEARLHGVAAGLHVLVELPAGTDEAALVTAAEHRGLRLYGLARHCVNPPPFPGIVLGYAAHTPHELTGAVHELAALARAGRSPT